MHAATQGVRRLPERVVPSNWWDRFRIKSRLALRERIEVPHLLRHYLVLKKDLLEQMRVNRQREAFVVARITDLGVRVTMYCRVMGVPIRGNVPLWREMDTLAHEYGYMLTPNGKQLRYTDMVINQPYSFPHLSITYCEPVEFLAQLRGYP